MTIKRREPDEETSAVDPVGIPLSDDDIDFLVEIVLKDILRDMAASGLNPADEDCSKLSTP